MQFLSISRRDGESIPINPLAVCYVRQTGDIATITMMDGQSFRIRASVETVLDAVEKAAGRDAGEKRLEVEAEPPPPPEGAAAPAGEAPASADEDAVAKASGAVGKASHDDDEPAHRGGGRR